MYSVSQMLGPEPCLLHMFDEQGTASSQSPGVVIPATSFQGKLRDDHLSRLDTLQFLQVMHERNVCAVQFLWI